VIDLHSHLLPGVDDGAPDIETSLAMARIAVADGIQVMACTPHFMPGVYDNESNDIRGRVSQLNDQLQQAGIDLTLVTGSDAHIRPDFLPALRDGRILRLNDSRYVLFEPPHNIPPPRLEDLLFNILVAGYVPILTHPERLKWIETNFDVFERLVATGIWMQITSGSLTGRFGKRPKYWAEKMLGSGMIHILATDAHNLSSRPAILSDARNLAAKELGADEADNMVLVRPVNVLDDQPMENSPPLPISGIDTKAKPSRWWRLFGREQQ
jgi:protein-tyrosine phosphatase